MNGKALGAAVSIAVGTVCLSAVPLAAAQGQDRAARGSVAESQAQVQAQATKGQALYQANCAACHDDKGFATRVLSRRVPADQAVLHQRRNLTREFVYLIVRQGTGSMPQIRKSELHDADLDAIAAYLETRR